MTFGAGPHFCLGNNLGRLEMSVAFTTLFRELPNLRLDPEEAPRRKSSLLFRGLHTLPALV